MEKEIVALRSNKEIYVKDNLVYKVFEEGYNKGNILNEALNQARVEETGLNIPKLTSVTLIDNKWAIISQYIEGKTLDQLLKENPDREDEYLKRFVDIQVEMQSKRCPLLNKHRDKMNRKISETDLAATLRYDLHNRIESMPRHNQLCHGDYNPSNVIIDNNDEAYIIDWSHATQGNIEADCARTFLLFLLDKEKERGRKYLDMFCEKTKTQQKDILAWLPILAASQSVKGISEQEELLRRIIVMDEKQLWGLYE